MRDYEAEIADRDETIRRLREVNRDLRQRVAAHENRRKSPWSIGVEARLDALEKKNA